MTSSRDLSQLSALLAAASNPTEKKRPAAKAIAPANDNKRAPDVLAWPTLERLAYRGDERRVRALRHWRNICFPKTVLPSQPDTDGDDTEARAEIRPSEGELLAAIGWTVTDREKWPDTGRKMNVYEKAEIIPHTSRNRNGGSDTQLGNLLFRDGKLIVWGETAKGRPLKPVERPGGPKGGVSAERTAAAIWAYLALEGAVSPLKAEGYRKPFSGEPAIACAIDPLPREEPNGKDTAGRFGVAEGRALLQALGVDGSVAFDDLPTPAARCPDALVLGPQWVGGVKKPKPLGEISAAAGGEPAALREVEGEMFVEFLRHHLQKHALVLDLAIGDATAKEIGVAMGQGPAYAEKRGPALIDAAIDALIALDETARIDIEPIPQKLAA
ncbi:hypothetical protein [Rhizobium sp. NFR03]|uniref:hypothetical protein n=1 Tax=Rhizobium sp. NFR03 TaxID=1566263 RepID=UPI0008BD5F83|nr:hypothetical protein [Rhizobium sp. NFR03]SES05829.1 hypothetical protein SAMN03159406_01972 [Rhizobium sp. NFR03]